MPDETFGRMLNDLAVQTSVPDYKFPSSVPLIGPVISACRRLLNSVSARWYVQYYVQSQSGFNAAVVEILRYQHDTMAYQLEQNKQRLLSQAAQLDALTTMCRELQQNAARNEEQLQALSMLLPELQTSEKPGVDLVVRLIVSMQEQILLTRRLFNCDLEALVRQIHARKP